MNGPSHIPVLVEEVLQLLDPRPGGVYADCTAGLGGHAERVAGRLGAGGTVVLNDLDPANLERAAARVRSIPDAPGVIPVRGSFAELPAKLAEQGLAADMVLADLGFASPQVDDPARGLSFSREGPLDMRMDPDQEVTAAHLVNTLPERELADLIWRLGEDRNARRIARKLVAAREQSPIQTTTGLACIVRSAFGGPRRERIDPATRTFQALRIAVNDELGHLESLLGSIARAGERCGRGEAAWLRPGARVAIISFHSLEDRPVKHAFVDMDDRGLAERLTRKPVRPGDEETNANPRARSAKLRAVRIME